MFDPFTILAALIPVFTHVVTKVTDHFTGGPSPTNTQELIELERVSIEKLKAIAALDSAEGASRWVTNVRAMMRPFAVVMILFTWGYIAVQYQISAALVTDLASSAVFYLFGDRTMMFITGKKK